MPSVPIETPTDPTLCNPTGVTRFAHVAFFMVRDTFYPKGERTRPASYPGVESGGRKQLGR